MHEKLWLLWRLRKPQFSQSIGTAVQLQPKRRTGSALACSSFWLSATWIWSIIFSGCYHFVYCQLILLKKWLLSTLLSTLVKVQSVHVLGIPTFVLSNVCMQVKLVNILTYVPILSNSDNKKLSYRWQTARCCFVKLLRYCRTFCQTRKVWLLDGEKNSKICLFILTRSTNVTDRRTDRQTDGRTDRHCMTA